jgi:hypothetical protein
VEIFRRGAQMVNGGDSPVVGDFEGVLDEVWRRTVSSYAWLVSMIASWRSSEVRLEWFRASECFGRR